jgi:hypothetical protein
MFLGLVLFQGVHYMEHVVQVLQRFVFGIPTGAGILGSWLDIEPVHFGYNLIFLSFVALCFWKAGYLKSSASRHGFIYWVMAFALLWQTYHQAEHIVKMVQFIDWGRNGTPGILGYFFNLAWLHFTYNTVALAPLLVVFFKGGYYGSAKTALSNAWRYSPAT